jgi:hypothetical protein
VDELGLKKGYTALEAALSSATYIDLMMQASGYISHTPLPISAGDFPAIIKRFATDSPEIQFTHAFAGLMRIPMMMAKHWVLRPLNLLISFATYPFTVTPEMAILFIALFFLHFDVPTLLRCAQSISYRRCSSLSPVSHGVGPRGTILDTHMLV